MPEFETGVDIGAGTGRFAEALGVEIGVEPSAAMRMLALMITVDCFLDDIPTAFQEARRILQPGGSFILGILDRESNLGRTLNAKKDSRSAHPSSSSSPSASARSRHFVRA